MVGVVIGLIFAFIIGGLFGFITYGLAAASSNNNEDEDFTVLYLCNGHACDKLREEGKYVDCDNPDGCGCKHTTDICYAKNFEVNTDGCERIWLEEKDRGDDLLWRRYTFEEKESESHEEMPI